MEDIEYLEEYEDLILPACLDLDNEHVASVADEMAAVQSDDDSLSTYDYIFERLFDDHSDTESVVQKKIDSKLSERQNDERASLDSLDMLVRDLNQHSVTHSKTMDCNQFTEDTSLNSHTKVVTNDIMEVSPAQNHQLSSASSSNAEQKVASTLKPQESSNNEIVKTKGNTQGATRKADSISISQIRSKTIATIPSTTTTQQKQNVSLPTATSPDIATSSPTTLPRKNITISSSNKPGKTSDSTITTTAAASTQEMLPKKIIYRSQPTIIKPKQPSPNRDPIEDPLSLDVNSLLDTDSSYLLSDISNISNANAEVVKQFNEKLPADTPSPSPIVSDVGKSLKSEFSSKQKIEKPSNVLKNDSASISTVSTKKLKLFKTTNSTKSSDSMSTKEETIKTINSEKVPQKPLQIEHPYSRSNPMEKVNVKLKQPVKNASSLTTNTAILPKERPEQTILSNSDVFSKSNPELDEESELITPNRAQTLETQVSRNSKIKYIRNVTIVSQSQLTSATSTDSTENKAETCSKKRGRGKRDSIAIKLLNTAPKLETTPLTRSCRKRRRLSSSDEDEMPELQESNETNKSQMPNRRTSEEAPLVNKTNRRVCFADELNNQTSHKKTTIKQYKNFGAKPPIDHLKSISLSAQMDVTLNEMATSALISDNDPKTSKINQTEVDNTSEDNDASPIKLSGKRFQRKVLIGQRTNRASNTVDQTRANQETINEQISPNPSKSSFAKGNKLSPTKPTNSVMTFSDWLDVQNTSKQKKKCEEPATETEKNVENIPAALNKTSEKSRNTVEQKPVESPIMVEPTKNMRPFLKIVKSTKSKKVKKSISISKNLTDSETCEAVLKVGAPTIETENNLSAQSSKPYTSSGSPSTPSNTSTDKANMRSPSMEKILTRKRRIQEIAKLIEYEPMDMQETNYVEERANKKKTNNMENRANQKNARTRAATTTTTNALEITKNVNQLDNRNSSGDSTLTKVKGSKQIKKAKEKKLPSMNSASLVSQLKHVQVRLNRHAVENYLKNQLTSNIKVRSRSQTQTPIFGTTTLSTTTTITKPIKRAVNRTTKRLDSPLDQHNVIIDTDTSLSRTHVTPPTQSPQLTADDCAQNSINSSKLGEHKQQKVDNIETAKESVATSAVKPTSVRSHQIGRPKILTIPLQNRRKLILSSSFGRSSTIKATIPITESTTITNEQQPPTSMQSQSKAVDSVVQTELSSKTINAPTLTTPPPTTTAATSDSAFTPIEPKVEVDYDASTSASEIPQRPASPPIGRLIGNDLSFGVPAPIVDEEGTRLYSFLHPARYHPDHGNVPLDFCCPNLDGPMSAIDPTRIHSQVQATIRELPAYIVLTTKMLTRADVEADKNAVPASIRQKMDEITASTTTNRLSVTTPNNINLTVRKDAVRQSGNSNTLSTLKTKLPVVAETPPITIDATSDVEYVIACMNRFDQLLRTQTSRMPHFSIPDRRQCIRDYISFNKVVPQDVDTAIRVLVNYTEFMHNQKRHNDRKRMQRSRSISAASKRLRQPKQSQKKESKKEQQQLQQLHDDEENEMVIGWQVHTSGEDSQISALKHSSKRNLSASAQGSRFAPSEKSTLTTTTLRHPILHQKLITSQSTSSSAVAAAAINPKSIALTTNKIATFTSSNNTETNIITVMSKPVTSKRASSSTLSSASSPPSLSQPSSQIIVSSATVLNECILPDNVDNEIKHEVDDGSDN